MSTIAESKSDNRHKADMNVCLSTEVVSMSDNNSLLSDIDNMYVDMINLFADM